jgi:hypothetical protein
MPPIPGLLKTWEDNTVTAQQSCSNAPNSCCMTPQMLEQSITARGWTVSGKGSLSSVGGGGRGQLLICLFNFLYMPALVVASYMGYSVSNKQHWDQCMMWMMPLQTFPISSCDRCQPACTRLSLANVTSITINYVRKETSKRRQIWKYNAGGSLFAQGRLHRGQT